MTMRRYEVLAILGVFLLSSVLVAGLGTISPASTGAHSSVSSFGGLPSSGRSVVTPAAGPVLSGPGEFFTSSAFPLVPFANRTCVASILPGGACPATKHANVTNDLAMNYTSGGTLAVAYTTMTNESPCDQGIVENYSQSNIAFLTSSDNGATWSSVQVLGNADCKSATTYPSSWEPTLTSLSNGTLVLAYVEYNTSVLVPFLNSYAPPVTQLVVTESYNNGGSWSTQQVVNVSSDPSLLVTFPAMRPSIAAFGNTIYLTWMSMQVSANGANPGASSQVSLLVSSNGGKSWSPTLPMTTSPYTNSGNPEVLVNPAGRAFLAYSSSLPYSGTV
ncbi:MAG TPA: sialidase family protein, partial [Thermoplasmata archaeon]|nr:sialidase family protein [Thermoplasmata archaeon]